MRLHHGHPAPTGVLALLMVGFARLWAPGEAAPGGWGSSGPHLLGIPKDAWEPLGSGLFWGTQGLVAAMPAPRAVPNADRVRVPRGSGGLRG